MLPSVRVPLGLLLFSGSLLVLLGGSGRADEPEVAEQRVDFASQIQPLLSDRCALCHGPDEASRAAELRVDTPDLLTHQSQNGGLDSIIVPGDAASSELIRRITSDDPGERMPPPDSNLALSPAEIDQLTRWIDQGAQWEQHWSLQPIRLPAIPVAEDGASEAGEPSPSPIDALVDAQLAAHGLAPAPPADPHSLIRRVTMDLTGLPPTPEEVVRFVHDTRPEAYERLVDRLIASPAFGERMTTPWLDVARYADTYGYQADVYRDVWPWRDWVIEAFASGLPYDKFLVHQLAGDLLSPEQAAAATPLVEASPAEAARDAALATAFNRLHRQTNEGGSVEEEFRTEYVADRVNTLGTAILGLTLECARCHDHKYDPISQQDYYQLFAFFNQIDESGLYSHFTDAVPTPVLDLPSDAQQQTLQRVRRAAREAERNYRTLLAERIAAAPATPPRIDALESDRGLLADEVAHYPFTLQPTPGGNEGAPGLSLANAVAGQPAGKWIGNPSSYEPPAGEAIHHRGGLLLDGENGFETEVGGDWDWWQPFTVGIWMRPAEHHERAVVWHRSRAWTDAGSRGYELLIEEGRLSAALIHFWPGDAVRVRAVEPLAVGRWSHVAVTSDGSGRAAGLRIYVDGQPAEVEVVRDCLKRTIRGGGATTLTIGNRFRDRGFKGGGVDDWRIFERDLTPAEVALLAGYLPSAVGDDALREAVIEATDAELRQARQSLREQRSQLAAARDAIPAIMAMRELDEPRETFLLSRGAYDAPAQAVAAEIPEVFGPLPPSLPHNRLGLARWLTDPDHPLVARVAANRIWQMLFDRPLVDPPDDFGMQGTPPSHPKLLDYLAGTLIADRWDLKRLTRRIVTSAAYRRGFTDDPQQRAADPENRWLARGPSSRWPVEMIRDAALAAGGLLDRQIGGPPVYPYQPPGLWSEKRAGSEYVRDVGAGSHRRSLYTIWKRTSPPPSMMIFDAPGREVCAAGRSPTETPLQALVLLNDEQFVEAARGVAFQVLRNSSEDPAEDAGRLCFRMLGREPTARERAVIVDLVQEQAKRFEEDPEARDAYLAVGDFAPLADENSGAGLSGAGLSGAGIDRTEWAAWSVAAQLLMNLDEWVSRR